MGLGESFRANINRIKALLSIQSAELHLREAIMLQRMPGQRETCVQAEVMACAAVSDAERYLLQKNDDMLEKAAKVEREDELNRQLLALGPRAEFASAK